MTQERFAVEQLADESRYALFDREAGESGPKEIGQITYVDTESAAGGMHRVFDHTSVSEAYGGQGLASVLARFAIESAIDEGCSVVPVCPYIAAWLPKHPEYAGSVVQPTPEHFQALRERRA